MSKKIPIKCKGNRYLPYNELKAFQGQLKEMSKADAKKLRDSILKLGWIAPAFVWNNNEIIDAHGRMLVLAELIKEGYTIDKIPIVDIEAKNREEAAEMLLQINSHYQKITEQGLYEFLNDFDLPVDILDEISIPDIDIEHFKDGFLLEIGGEGADPDDIPEVPEEPITKMGDLYEIGSHRVLCGDSTKKEDVERVMNGEKAGLLYTDPPYGDLIITDKKGRVGKDNIAKCKKYYKYANEGDFDYSPILKFIEDYTKKQIVWGGNYFADILPITTSWICWDKRAGVHNWFSDFELAWTNLGIPARLFSITWQGMIRQGESEERIHPTQKPIELAIKCIELAKSEKIILDLFLGSGTTLIACEKTNRKCYGIEIDCHYIDVIITRWCNFTGISKIKRNGEEIDWTEVSKK